MSLTVVIPHKDRVGPRIFNCMRAIQLQTVQPKVIFVDYGSSVQNWHDLEKYLIPELDIEFMRVDPSMVSIWSLSRARNRGIRAAKTPFIACLDLDVIMEPKVLELTLTIMDEIKKPYIATKLKMLLPGIDYSKLELPKDYELLREYLGNMSFGYGGFCCAKKELFYELQGFDERMVFWGAEDVDMWFRAMRDKSHCIRINDFDWDDIGMYHQYHADSISTVEGQENLTSEEWKLIRQNQVWSRTDLSIKRNDENWGLTHE